MLIGELPSCLSWRRLSAVLLSLDRPSITLALLSPPSPTPPQLRAGPLPVVYRRGDLWVQGRLPGDCEAERGHVRWEQLRIL